MTETAEVKKDVQRIRPTRRSIFIREIHFDIVEKGYSEVPILRERQIEDESVLADVNYTIDHFIKNPKKTKIIRKKGSQTSVVHRGQFMEQETWLDESNVRRYRGVPVPLNRKHVTAAKLYRTDAEGYTEDDDGPIKPWLHMLFADGSQLDTPLLKSRKRGK